jgi:hypothetical protein
MVFHGGYDFDTVYNMPIWMRNQHYELLAKTLKLLKGNKPKRSQ